VNGDSPVDLLHSYVPLNFTHDKAFVDGYELIEQIRRKRNVVISGAAGSGKSMFMRYLWISCFVDSRGKIPLFIELRALNSLSKDDLLTFVFHTVVQPSLSEPQGCLVLNKSNAFLGLR
jgi:predicted NACHT family NTPase